MFRYGCFIQKQNEIEELSINRKKKNELYIFE